MENDFNNLLVLFSHLDYQDEFFPIFMMPQSNLTKDYLINSLLTNTYAKYLILNKAGSIAGFLSTFKAIPYFDAIEVGCHVFKKEDRGKGITTEALTLFTNYIFEAKALSRIEARMTTVNLAGERAVKKAGFTKEGTHKNAVMIKRKFFDVHTYAKLRSEWLMEK